MENEEALPTIVVPGPELREKVDGFAARLSGLDRRKADEMVAKLLASSKRHQFLFVDTSHIFYPYFLSKLTEFRQHPELRPQKAGEGKDGGDGAAGAATTTKAGTITRTTGGTAGAESDPQREELLRQTEAEARRYLEDPFPNHYALDQRAGTVDVTALLMDVLSTTAQYVAKYGDKFLDAVKGKQRHNPLFHFLQEDDVRHGMFRKLVESYRRILNFDAEETETRLENLASTSYLLDTVCAEKHKYAKSALARRRAALLTDEELRGRLQWTLFSVVQTFKLSDLQLDGPVPDTAASKQRPVVSTHYLSPSLTSAGGSGLGEGSSTSAAGSGRPAGGRSGGAASPGAAASPPAAAAPGAAPSRTATLRPPGAPPTGFAPVFMSSSLVKNTGSNGKRPRERGG